MSKQNMVQVYKARLTSNTVYVKAQKYEKTKKVPYMIHVDNWASWKRFAGHKPVALVRNLDNEYYQAWPQNAVELSPEQVDALPKFLKTEIEKIRNR